MPLCLYEVIPQWVLGACLNSTVESTITALIEIVVILWLGVPDDFSILYNIHNIHNIHCTKLVKKINDDNDYDEYDCNYI